MCEFSNVPIASPPAEMPPATDLTMSHFSPSCVLLRWTPASSPAHLTTVLQGYRIYVNGVPEGMVCVCVCVTLKFICLDTKLMFSMCYDNGQV